MIISILPPFLALNLTTIRMAALIAIALIYALFDVFNKRDIPDVVAYASVALGIIFTLTLGSIGAIIFSALVALVIGSACYLLYRAGQLGLGDGFEFVALSLIIPVQQLPLFFGGAQYSLPFILSIFVATGFVTIILVPIYYIAKMSRAQRKEAVEKIQRKEAMKAAILFFAYMALLLFVTYFFGFKVVAALIILLIAIWSAIMALFERGIMGQMIEMIYPKELGPGDMIAVDVMKKGDISYFKRKSNLFGKLASKELISKISKVRRKIPVYKNAVPLALPTLFGVIVALFVGNLLLFII